MFMKIQMSTLPSWVTGSRLSESLAREKVNDPPAVPAGAALAAVLAEAAGVPAALLAALLAGSGTVAVTFWLMVNGAELAAAADGFALVLAAGAVVAVAVAP